MEELGWKKDETSYIVFQCKKCHQYLYVKITQKTKKCLRCRRNHKVETIKESSEIVLGISTAVEMVKTRQNQLARKELGSDPDLRAFGDFKAASSSSKSYSKNQELEKKDGEYLNKFREMLIKIYSMYKKFPIYVLEVIGDNYSIPSSEIKILTRNFLMEGILIRLEDNQYTVKVELIQIK